MNPLIHFLLTAMALLIPICSCAFIGFRLNSKNNLAWQTVACFSVLAIASSLLLLLVAGEIEFLKYGEAQVNRKLNEVRALTEQNKLIAERIVELVALVTSDSRRGLMPLDAADPKLFNQSVANLLKAAGLSESEIQKFIYELNQVGSKTNSP